MVLAFAALGPDAVLSCDSFAEFVLVLRVIADAFDSSVQTDHTLSADGVHIGVRHGKRLAIPVRCSLSLLLFINYMLTSATLKEKFSKKSKILIMERLILTNKTGVPENRNALIGNTLVWHDMSKHRV